LLIYILAKKDRSQLSCGIEVLQRVLDTSCHRLLPLPNPDTGIVIFLIRLVLSFWIAHLLHKIILLVQYVVADAGKVRPLEVSIKVHFDDAVSDRVQVLLLGGSRATVENQENRLVFLCSDGILDVLLVLAQQFRVKLNIARLVDTVDIPEGGGYREIWGDWRQGLVDIEDILRLGIKRVVVDILIVNAVLFAASDTDLLERIVSQA
jgi:hypothetical protein